MASHCTSSNNCESSFSKTKDDLLNEILKCGICLSRMSSPCCLPCAHSFCRSCLLEYAENNNLNTSIMTNYISCPYCKFRLNFHSFKHLESILVINPILKQLCEVLESSHMNSDSSSSQTSNIYRARCHTCCSLKMLKICKHCSFMLCETCRRTHLLDVHRESKFQLETLESRLRLINEKRLQMDTIAREYDHIRHQIRTYTERLTDVIKQQRNQALQILDERQHSNDEIFWTRNGFDNGEKLDFFVSLLENGKRKLSAKNITDRDLIELSDNLQTIPDVNEKIIQSISFAELALVLDESFLTKEFIHVKDKELSTKTINVSEKLTTDNEQSECVKI